VVVVGNQDDTKLLGTPKFDVKARLQTGDVVVEKILKLLKEWNCSDNIVNMAFDTIAANTGHLSAVYIKVQEKLGHSVTYI